MKADQKTGAAVEALWKRFSESYANRDLDGLLACIAPDEDVIMYGTGADEKRTGQEGIRAQAERDWAQTEAISVSYDRISVSAAGSVAWAAADGAFVARVGGQEMAIPARMTLVCEKRGKDWLVVHAHFSAPAAGQEAGESIPA